VALIGTESQLLTVPQIDFRQYPDGIVQTGGASGADITGGMTAASARDLATRLRYGPLPLALRVSNG
jgi:preprotein translocase subunit SecD